MPSDTLICWAFSRAGLPIRFAPQAQAAHHHVVNGWAPYWHERFRRGSEYGWHRLQEHPWPAWRVLLHLVISSIVPLRLLKLTWRGWLNAGRAGMAARYLWACPIVISGQAAWLAGETAAYVRWLAGKREAARCGY